MDPADYDGLPQQLRDLLQSNKPVVGADSIVLTDYIQDRERTLTTRRADVASISQRILNLKEEERALLDLIASDEQSIMMCKRRLGISILTLPTEILEIIFSYSLPNSLQQCHLHALTYTNQPPFSLAQVCQQWRHLALGMPSLWASFTIRNVDHTSLKLSDSPKFREFIKAHYERSRDLPKSLDLYVEPAKYIPSFGQEEMVDLTQTASALFNNDITIKYLTLGSPRLDLLVQALGNSATMDWWNKQTISEVESLVLYSGVSYMPVMRAELFSRKRLRALRRITLSFGPRISPPRLIETYFIPWKNLTHVAITSWMDYRRFGEFFPSFTSLEHGIFYISDDQLDFVEGTPTTFKSLSDLTLIFDKEGPASRTLTFDRHTYPALTHFRLGAHDQPHLTQAFELQHLHCTLSNLTSLALCHSTWEAPVAHLLEILHLTSRLCKLELGVSTNYDQLLQHFQVDWDGVALLPQLEEFMIDCRPSGYGVTDNNVRVQPVLLVLTPEAFAGMVKDRWRPPLDTIRQLRRASLFLRKGQGNERMLNSVKEALMDEVREGLEIELGENGRPRWVDPFGRRVTHWHEGLVLPEESDCAQCLKMRQI